MVIKVPNRDKNGSMIYDTDDIDIFCEYEEKYNMAVLRANRTGLIAIAKICLQLANSTDDIIHAELDEFNYFEKNSIGLSIEKKNNS